MCITVVGALRTAALDPSQQLELSRSQLALMLAESVLIASADRMRLSTLVSGEATSFLLTCSRWLQRQGAREMRESPVRTVEDVALYGRLHDRKKVARVAERRRSGPSCDGC